MVGTNSVFVTSCLAIMWKACSGSNPTERNASTGTPWNHDGISTSISPAIQAQSDADHITSPGCGKKSCCISMHGMCPSSERWACSAPLAGPVVPEVNSRKAGSSAAVSTVAKVPAPSRSSAQKSAAPPRPPSTQSTRASPATSIALSRLASSVMTTFAPDVCTR